MTGPLSVEDIVAKQRAEREAAAKVRSPYVMHILTLTSLQPKFLSKTERAALALEKRNAEVKVQQIKEEGEARERLQFDQAAEEERRRGDAARYGGGDSNGSDGRCKFDSALIAKPA